MENKISCKCLICGIEFAPSQWKCGKLKRAKRLVCKKFCSEICRGKYLYKKHYKTYQNRWLTRPGLWKWKIEKECAECAKKFVPNNSVQITCSRLCGKRYTRKKYKKANREKVLAQARKDARRKARADWKEKQCAYCQKTFLPDLGHKNQQIYCSKKCQYEVNSKKAVETGRKKLHRKLYTERNYDKIRVKDKEYKERISFGNDNGSKSNNRQTRLKMDKHTCQKCGEATPSKLIVHHNTYPATVEHLITLCRKCHLWIHHHLEGKFYSAYKAEEILKK